MLPSPATRLCLLLSACLLAGAATAAPVQWEAPAPTIEVADGTVTADCGEKSRGDGYLLARGDYSDFVLEFDCTRLRPLPAASRERGIVVWGLDRANVENRHSYFLSSYLAPVGRTVHLCLAVLGGEAQLRVDGRLVARGGTADYGKPLTRGAVGLLHYFEYALRYEHFQLYDLSEGRVPALAAPRATPLPSGAVRVSWEVPQGLAGLAEVEVWREGRPEPLARVLATEYLDRATKRGDRLSYRVRLRLAGREPGPASPATTVQVASVRPVAPPRAAATVRLDGSVRVSWTLEAASRAAAVIVYGAAQPLKSAAGARVLARLPATDSGSQLLARPPAHLALQVTDPAGGGGAFVPLSPQPSAPLRPDRPLCSGRHPCLRYTYDDLQRVRADKSPEAAAAIADYVSRADKLLAEKVVIPGKVQSLGEASAGESDKHYSMASNCLTLAYAYAFTGEEKYAAKAREVLVGYADVYLTYPTTNGRCRVMTASGLWESVWYIRLLEAYDLTFEAGVWSAGDRTHLERDLLRPAVDLFTLRDHSNPADPRVGDLHYKCYNFQAWFDAAVGLTGLLLRDADMFEYALDGTYGLKHLIAHDLFDDGLFWERSIGYHGFVRSALLPLLEAAWHEGYDLYHLQVPDTLQEPVGVNNYQDGDHGPKTLKLLWEAPFYLQFADGRFPVVGDSSGGPLQPDESTWVGWRRYGDPRLLWLLHKAPQSGGLARLVYGPLPPDPGRFSIGTGSFARIGRNECGSTLFPSAGFAVLRQDEHDRRSMGLCLTYGPYGGGHGHPDKLSLVLNGLGWQPLTDFGSCAYASPLKGSWTHQTVSHNTLVVDGRTQATNTTGRLEYFHASDVLKTARARDDALYPGVTLQRTVLLIGPVVLDLFRAESREEHQYDYVLHIDGELQGQALPPRAAPLGTEAGYQHLEEVRSTTVSDDWQGLWRGPAATLATTLLAEPGAPAAETTEICSARSLTNKPEAKMPLLLARRQAKSTTFVTVLDTFERTPHVTELRRLGPRALCFRLDGVPTYVLWEATQPTTAGPLTAQGKLVVVKDAPGGPEVAIVEGTGATLRGR